MENSYYRKSLFAHYECIYGTNEYDYLIVSIFMNMSARMYFTQKLCHLPPAKNSLLDLSKSSLHGSKIFPAESTSMANAHTDSEIPTTC